MSTQGIFGKDRRLRISVNAQNHGTVLVGDQDVSAHVRGISFRGAVGEPAHAELELAVFNATEIDSASTQLVMTIGTEELLTAAGWLPPSARGHIEYLAKKLDDQAGDVFPRVGEMVRDLIRQLYVDQDKGSSRG